MLMTLISMLGGGLLRLAPEIFAFLNKGKDYAHELAMQDKQLEMMRFRGQDERETRALEGDIQMQLTTLQATMEAVKGQMQLTGVKFIDGLNFLVRPLTTYFFLGLYGAVKVATIAIALNSTDAWHAILLSWDVDDRAILSGILAFWFVGRVFDKARQ